MATNASRLWNSEVVAQANVRPCVESSQPRALPPLAEPYAVRQELIDDALTFMDEYDDVFRSLAQ